MEPLKIIHVDMDAFYASIEIRDNPHFQGKPVVVGGSDPKARGVVSAASYEARRFGVKSAMPLIEAYRRCPNAVFLPVNMEKYLKVSEVLMEIFKSFTPIVEPLSIDEAFLDTSGSEALFGNSIEIGQKIKERILKELNLVASIGIANNKFLAKLASGLRKPAGFVVIYTEDISKILHPLPVEKLWGVGEKTALFLRKQGFITIGQIARSDPALLKAKIGILGESIWRLAQGIDYREVETANKAKSVGREHTFSEDISDEEHLKAVILYLAEDVGQKLRIKKIKGKTISIKLRYANFDTITRRKTLSEPTNLGSLIYKTAKELLNQVDFKKDFIRLIGVTVSSLVESSIKRPTLFEGDDKDERVAATVDLLKEKYGDDVITLGRLLELKKKK